MPMSEPNPYDTRGDIYARFGRLDEAIASYKMAVEIKPDYGSYKLGCMYAYKGDFEQAESECRRALKSSDAGVRRTGRNRSIDLLVYRGRYTEALEAFESGGYTERMEGVTPRGPEAIWRLSLKARILRYVDTVATATTEIVNEVERWQPTTFWECYHACRCMLELGRVEAAHVASARGDYDNAIASNDTLWNRAAWVARDFWPQFIEACFNAKRWDDVVRVGERALMSYPVRRIRDARIHYYLGVAYQEVGRNDEAIEQLEKLLTIWEGADPGLEGLEDARERLTSLKASG
jgi:tetratricopeptide (TPR) repeat protein